MKLFLLLYSTAIALIHVLSHPITEEFASFSPNGNLLSEKQLRSKDFREYDETEVSLNTRLLRPHYCHSLKKAECISLNYTTCFGVKIPYSKTSLSLVSEITSLEEAQVSELYFQFYFEGKKFITIAVSGTTSQMAQ